MSKTTIIIIAVGVAIYFMFLRPAAAKTPVTKAPVTPVPKPQKPIPDPVDPFAGIEAGVEGEAGGTPHIIVK